MRGCLLELAALEVAQRQGVAVRRRQPVDLLVQPFRRPAPGRSLPACRGVPVASRRRRPAGSLAPLRPTRTATSTASPRPRPRPATGRRVRPGRGSTPGRRPPRGGGRPACGGRRRTRAARAGGPARRRRSSSRLWADRRSSSPSVGSPSGAAACFRASIRFRKASVTVSPLPPSCPPDGSTRGISGALHGTALIGVRSGTSARRLLRPPPRLDRLRHRHQQPTSNPKKRPSPTPRTTPQPAAHACAPPSPNPCRRFTPATASWISPLTKSATPPTPGRVPQAPPRPRAGTPSSTRR